MCLPELWFSQGVRSVVALLAQWSCLRGRRLAGSSDILADALPALHMHHASHAPAGSLGGLCYGVAVFLTSGLRCVLAP